jgi:hypothetical protein
VPWLFKLGAEKISLLQKTMFLAQQMGYIVSQKEVGW